MVYEMLSTLKPLKTKFTVIMKKSAFLKFLGLEHFPKVDKDSDLDSNESFQILSSQELEQWQSSERTEVSQSFDQKITTIIQHCQAKQTFAFYYQAGSNPGLLRKVDPICVFRTQDSDITYLIGHCLLRDAQRTFRIDRISLA